GPACQAPPLVSFMIARAAITLVAWVIIISASTLPATMPSTLTKRLGVIQGFVSKDRSQRYQSRHRLLSFLAKRSGFRIYDAYTTWFEDQSFEELWAGSPWKAVDLDARRYFIFQTINALRHLPGDTAECGVGTGVTSYIIVKCLEGSTKTHHIFDSFEGLSEPRDEDTVEAADVFKWQKN